ncbi:MAG TPA: ATP-binding protein [Labilithrix sp.]|nr:ATP-binding protein [Labilithrix sp.]
MESDDRLSNRLAWVTGLRLGILTLLLGSAAFFYLRGELSEYPQSQTLLLWVIGSAFALAAVYAFLLRRKRQLRRLAEVQIVLDQLTWTALVYVTGGATSGATSFYGLTCVLGAVLIGLRGAAIAAIAGVSAFTALCTAFAFRWVAPPSDQRGGHYLVEWDTIIFPLGVNALGVIVVALLGAYLAERLRRTGGELQEANERAASAERLAVLGRIAAGLAHEIRNPLGSISGSIELLREAPGLTEEDRRLCEIIQREAARLNHLVSDMMDLARPRPPSPEVVDVAALAREVVELASRSERSGSGDVSVTYDGPEASAWALCDGGQMRQVLWNLVRNAVQASGAGSTVRVSVRERAPEAGTGRRILLAVSDSGPGISPSSQRRIFDAFFTTRSNGAGIGLAVVRRIIDEHASVGASIHVRNGSANGGKLPSDRTTGATFEVGLACAAPPSRTTTSGEVGVALSRGAAPGASARSHSENS